MNPLFSSIATAWKQFVSHKKLIPLVVLVDILFLYGITRLHYEVFNRASVLAIKLSAMVGEQVQGISESEAAPELAVLQSAEFLSLYHELIRHIAIFFIGGLLVWLVAKGIAWFIAHKSVAKKVDVVKYALKFAGMTLFWFVIFILLLFGVLNLLDYALFGVFPLIGKAGANVLAVFFFWALAYFVFISYSLLPGRMFVPTFKLGVKHWKDLLPVHIIGSLIFFVAATTPTFLVKANIYLPLAFVIIIALPALAWMRVFWITSVQRVMKNG
jgi:hypothetical protein